MIIQKHRVYCYSAFSRSWLCYDAAKVSKVYLQLTLKKAHWMLAEIPLLRCINEGLFAFTLWRFPLVCFIATS